MAVVVAALLPVFLLIVLGFILKRTLMRLETQWHGLERLTYYVLFPMLLIQTLVKADLTKVPVAGVGGALLLSALLMSLLCLALRPLLARCARRRPRLHLDLPGRDPLADLCGARRLRQSVRRRSGWRWPRSRWSPSSRWSMCSASAVLAHYASPKSARSARIVMTVVRNPADLGLRDRARAQRRAHPAAQTLARGRRRARPLLARDRPAGHRRRPAPRRHVPPEPRRLGGRVPQAGADAGASRWRWRCGSAFPAPTSRS